MQVLTHFHSTFVIFWNFSWEVTNLCTFIFDQYLHGKYSKHESVQITIVYLALLCRNSEQFICSLAQTDLVIGGFRENVQKRTISIQVMKIRNLTGSSFTLILILELKVKNIMRFNEVVLEIRSKERSCFSTHFVW